MSMTQQSLLPEPVSAERAAFDAGDLYLIVKDHPRYNDREWSSHVNARAFFGYSKPFATVHVISRSAGGEIRGYMWLEGLLYLRMPSYPPDWANLDLEVSRHVGCPVVTHEAPTC